MTTVDTTRSSSRSAYGGADSARRPEPLDPNPVKVIAGDVVAEVRGIRRGVGFPPGPSRPDLRMTLRFTRYPLPVLLELYERYGPVFSVRLLHQRMVWMIGPAANHFMTVERPELFSWREGHFGDLTPLIGDGILTTDGEYHDRARRIMMPAFHRERIEDAVATMVAETERALAVWRPGEVVDVYQWARELALAIAMRALLGLDPHSAHAAAEHFERALSFYGTDAPVRLLRGPGTPFQRLLRARESLDRIVYAEVARRRASSDRGMDVLSMLLDSTDEDGSSLSDEEIRDQLVTLLFAGHDTSTSTIAFLLHELAHHPDDLARIRAEQARVLGVDPPRAEHVGGQALPELEMAIDEALRLHPPVWIGARRAVADFEFDGAQVPAGAYVNYSSWATQRLPDLFPEPAQFRPHRFTREKRTAMPRGAYLPFGGGSRICIGKRFGQTIVRTLTTLLLQRYELELPPGHELRFAMVPTLSPKDGLPMRVRPRRD